MLTSGLLGQSAKHEKSCFIVCSVESDVDQVAYMMTEAEPASEILCGF
jgi:hypothetical protein